MTFKRVWKGQKILHISRGMGLRRETVFQSSFVGGSFMMFVPLS
jgi:hypothetical protein